MHEEDKTLEKYLRAKNRARRVRKFYLTAVRLLLAAVLFILLEDQILEIFKANGVRDEDTLRWMEWNIRAFPIVFVLILLVKGFKTFVLKSSFIKKWEDEQLRKYMREDEQ